MLLFWLAAVFLLAMAVVLEEAAVGFARDLAGSAPGEAEEPETAGAIRAARQCGLLARLLEGAGFALAMASAARRPSAAAVVGVVVLTVGWALAGSAWSGVRWNERLGQVGRAVFQPLRGVGMLLRWALPLFGRIPGFGVPLPSAERLRERNQEIGWLLGSRDGDEEGKMVASLREFGESRARDVMVPREEVVGVPADASRAEILELVERQQFSRYPVFRETLDTVVGVLHVFDLLTAPAEARAADLARDPFLTNDTKPVSVLLRELQVTYNQMAVVVDEYGGTAGIVTVEDLLEELVGEIRDELDVEEGEGLRRLEPGVYWVDAAMRLEDLNEALKLDLKEGDYDTVAGWILERLERIPRPGEKIREDGVWIEVLAAEPHRINAVKVTVTDRAGEQPAAERREER